MLRDEIDSAQRLIKTDTVQITIGEIARMYDEVELDVLPDFQRLFRWSIEKKSSFIESILIGIPIPPAFAYENSDGTWELIDGLQRVSTILEFMGLLRNPDEKGALLVSRLTNTKYLPALDGACWTDDDEQKLSRALKIIFRRARVDFQVLKHPSDPRTKYDLFQRLNRGGAYANAQEVRSCSMLLANRDLTREIKHWASSEQFREIFRINDNSIKTQENIEYAIRLKIHSAHDFSNDSDVQEYLDKTIIEILMSKECETIVAAARWSVDALYRVFGNRALLPMGDAIGEVGNRFSLRALEAIASGIARNRQGIERCENADRFIKERVEAFWQERQVWEMSASGLRGTTRLQRTIPFGVAWFNPDV